MKSLIIFILFVGMFMIVSGVYEQRIEEEKQKREIEYKFIPRTMYEEQLASNTSFAAKVVDPMFKSSDVLAYDPREHSNENLL